MYVTPIMSLKESVNNIYGIEVPEVTGYKSYQNFRSPGSTGMIAAYAYQRISTENHVMVKFYYHKNILSVEIKLGDHQEPFIFKTIRVAEDYANLIGDFIEDVLIQLSRKCFSILESYDHPFNWDDLLLILSDESNFIDAYKDAMDAADSIITKAAKNYGFYPKN